MEGVFVSTTRAGEPPDSTRRRGGSGERKAAPAPSRGQSCSLLSMVAAWPERIERRPIVDRSSEAPCALCLGIDEKEDEKRWLNL
jgi:hypothetical protein